MDQSKAIAHAKQLAECFKRNLIAIPLVHKYPHQGITQRSGLRAATLEFDTASFPNIEYIAGTRMSIYPPNQGDEVERVCSKLIDDLTPNTAQFQVISKLGLKQSLTHLFDIRSAPTPEVLQVLADYAKSHVQREILLELSKKKDAYDKWLSIGGSELRTLSYVLDELTNKQVSAKALLNVLPLQAARQYSVSSIKSTKRFRTEIIVVQHKFTCAQISAKIQMLREALTAPSSPLSPIRSQQSNVTPKSIDANIESSRGSRQSLHSLRSLAAHTASPISTHQVKRVPSFSGPLISRYASSASGFNKTPRVSTKAPNQKQQQLTTTPTNQHQQKQQALLKSFDGLCSEYLLNLQPNKDFVVCEFVENPRFTLKGNRERPILMIGQDIGLVAFRAFWQQRSLEFDRAQVFYTLFKDLAPKKFGEMHFVTIGGSSARLEDLFKREINSMLTNKILTTCTNIQRNSLHQLIQDATTTTTTNEQTKTITTLDSIKKNKELYELGIRMARLLSELNGCIYTCCEWQVTQAIELLIIESLASLMKIARDKAASLLPKWKGRRPATDSNVQKFVFTLENNFERAQLVHEVYDSSL